MSVSGVNEAEIAERGLARRIHRRKLEPSSSSIARLARSLRERELSAVEILEAHLERIETLDPDLRAFISVGREGARDAAARADAELRSGTDRGLLHGIPMAVKDLFATKGEPTTAGSRILADNVTDDDAEAVRLLRRSGAVLVGKTNLNEFAFSVTGINPHYGTVRNPHDRERITGGSSSGSAAAVAAGMSVAALGTDTGGSIRIPACLTGVVGFKPTYGAVPVGGLIPLSWSLDHVGSIARSVEDASHVFHALAGRKPAAPVRIPPGSLRVGTLEDYCSGLDDRVSAGWERFLAQLSTTGAEIVNLHLGLSREVMLASTTIMFSEAATVHAEWLKSRRDLYDPQIRERLLQGALLPATTYLKAQQIRRRIVDRALALFERVDVLACPTQPMVASRISEVGPETIRRMLQSTRLAPLVGLPALTLPLPSDGLPIGLQLLGPLRSDDYVLGVAAGLEELTSRSV